jgi:hypothetical protein
MARRWRPSYLNATEWVAVDHRCGLGQLIPLNHEAARGALERLPYLGGVAPGQQDHCTATVDTAVHSYRQALDTGVNLAWYGSSAGR